MEKSSPKQVLTTGEIGAYCGVSFRTVIRWIEKGRLKAYKLPGRGDHRIPVENFLQFLEANQIPVPPDLLPEGRKILVVEDNPQMARSIQRLLHDAGFEVRTAQEGLQAGVLLASWLPTVMTLDLRLPGLSGQKVLEFVKGHQALSRLKILVISALPIAELEKTLEQGADDFLQKPFENEVLLSKIGILSSNQGFTQGVSYG
jgi:two-component system, OmpR family, response regulator VicR